MKLFGPTVLSSGLLAASAGFYRLTSAILAASSGEGLGFSARLGSVAQGIYDGTGLVLLGLYLLAVSALVGGEGGASRVRRRVASLLDQDKLHRDWVAVAVLAPVALAMVAIAVFKMPSHAVIALDSAGYLNFHIQRPLFYPVFLRLGAAAFGSFKAVAIFQLLLGMVATLFLAECLQRTLRNYLISVPVGLALMINWAIFLFGAYILSDYLFLVWVMLYPAFVG